MRRRAGTLLGKPLATVAIVLPVLFFVFVELLWHPIYMARVEYKKPRSCANLRAIAQAAHMWSFKYGHDMFYPPSIRALLDNGLVPDPSVFLVPEKYLGVHVTDSKLRGGEFVSDYDDIFRRAGFRITTTAATPLLPLAWEGKRFYEAGRNVVFFNSHFEFVTEERFQELMKQVDDCIAEHRPKPGE